MIPTILGIFFSLVLIGSIAVLAVMIWSERRAIGAALARAWEGPRVVVRFRRGDS